MFAFLVICSDILGWEDVPFSQLVHGNMVAGWFPGFLHPSRTSHWIMIAVALDVVGTRPGKAINMPDLNPTAATKLPQIVQSNGSTSFFNHWDLILGLLMHASTLSKYFRRCFTLESQNC